MLGWRLVPINEVIKMDWQEYFGPLTPVVMAVTIWLAALGFFGAIRPKARWGGVGDTGGVALCIHVTGEVRAGCGPCRYPNCGNGSCITSLAATWAVTARK